VQVGEPLRVLLVVHGEGSLTRSVTGRSKGDRFYKVPPDSAALHPGYVMSESDGRPSPGCSAAESGKCRDRATAVGRFATQIL